MNVFNLVIPAICYICNKRITDQRDCLCQNCEKYLERKYGILKAEEKLGQLYFFKVASIYDFGHISRELIHIYKYRSIKEIGRFFGKKAVEVLKNEYKEFTAIDGILSVPMHRKRYQERSFDHAHFLCDNISKSLKITDYSYLLKKNKNSQKQSFLDFEARLKNPLNTFTVKKNNVLPGKTILLIDDIFTTGATANALCKVLSENGVKKIYVFTIASGSDPK